MPSHGFPKARRVRRRSEFQQVFDRGTRVHGRYLTVLMAPNASPLTRLGIVASRKIGGAVQRNRAKRLIREVFRREAGLRPGLDVVVIPKREILDAPFATLVADIRQTWKRCAGRLPRHDR